MAFVTAAAAATTTTTIIKLSLSMIKASVLC